MITKLEDFLEEVSERTTRNDQYPVLTSSRSGLFLQNSYFTKQIASKDNAGYKVIRRGEFTYRAMSDTGAFYPNMLECADVGIVSPAYPVFRISKDVIIPEYLKYYFKSESFQRSIMSFVQGSTRASMKFSKMKTISLDLPNKATQLKTIRTLNQVKEQITLKTKELDLLDILIKARFVEMFGGKDIDVISIGDAVELINGRAFKPTDWAATGLPIIRIQNLNDKAAPFNYYDGAYDKKNYVQKGELLFSWSGTPGTSFGAFIWDRGPGILNQHIFRVLPRIDLDLNYLRYALNDQLEIIISKAHGGVGLQHITKGELEKVLIPSPNKKQQLGFSTFVAQVDKSKFAVEHIPITLEGPS